MEALKAILFVFAPALIVVVPIEISLWLEKRAERKKRFRKFMRYGDEDFFIEL